jgi:hypothetical protein
MDQMYADSVIKLDVVIVCVCENFNASDNR